MYGKCDAKWLAIYLLAVLVALSGCRSKISDMLAAPGGALQGGPQSEFEADMGTPGEGLSPALPEPEVEPPAGQYASDTLFAIPQQTTAAVGDQVTVLVVTGIPAHPFQYMSCCSVTVETGATYVANSFNVGEIGGVTGDADGFWAEMNPSDGFLLPPDNFLFGQETALGDGRHRLSFNVTPIGGSELLATEGALCNFQLEFSEPGVYTLGFLDATGVVKRTYYSDSAPEEYFWGDISNNHEGFAKSITVN